MKHLVLALLMLPASAMAQTQPSLLEYYDINGFVFGTVTDLNAKNPMMLPKVAIYESVNGIFYLAPNGGPWLDSAVVWEDPAPQISMEFQQVLRLNARDSVFMDTLAAHNTRLISGLSRANHSGSQAISTVTGLQAALDSKLTTEVDGSTTNEIELPSMSGQSGKLLSNNGSAATWVDAPAAITFNYPTRSLNSAFQISATKNASVSYTVDVACTLSIAGGQTGTVTLEYADDSGFTTNVQTVQSTVNGNTGTLTIGLNMTQTASCSLSGMIPAGKYVRIRTTNTTGTPSFTYRRAQEVY